MTEQVIQPAEEVTVKRREYAEGVILRDSEFRLPYEVRDAYQYRVTRKPTKYAYTEPCYVCGRLIRDDKFEGCWFVHATIFGGVIRVDVEPAEDDDLGWFAVGPECHKKVPSEFKKKFRMSRESGMRKAERMEEEA